MSATLGTGSTLSFGTNTTFLPELLSVEFSGRNRESINSSHMGTSNAHTFIPASLVDNGTITATFHHDGTDDFETLINHAGEMVTVQWGAAGVSWACTAFVTDVSASSPLEDKMTATMTLKCTGTVNQDITP